MLEQRYTRHQVPRGALPDAEQDDKIYLFKNVSTLRATYQVRLLVFRAAQTGKRLVVRVPRACKLHPTLAALRREAGKALLIERV